MVNEATMRPMLVGPHARRDLINALSPPDAARGALSRAQIAARTGLARETVRRKVSLLMALNLVHEREDKQVQCPARLMEAVFQQIADECFAAVERYEARLHQLGQEGAGSEHWPQAGKQQRVATGAGETLPARVRPRAYAACELFLDMLWSLRSRMPQLDLDMVVILVVVNEAAMRPLLTGMHARRDLFNHPAPPDRMRGAISRVLIADRTGLSRETVRRKVNALIGMGVCSERGDGEVQPAPQLDRPELQAIGDECFAAVRRYRVRLSALGSEDRGST
ncbi:MAG: hypothetical protein JNJ63_10955 [Hyphomonadaceae bacterium]|nr:hypothetical protein [Hyphomonadaceae bacterium]